MAEPEAVEAMVDLLGEHALHHQVAEGNAHVCSRSCLAHTIVAAGWAPARSARARWERGVLNRFLSAIPATRETPDYVHALTAAMLAERAVTSSTQSTECDEVGTATSRGYCYACPTPIEVGDLWRWERVGDDVPHAHRLVHHPECPPASVSALSPVETPTTRVHNHSPYRPVCNERTVAGRLRGACINDDESDRMSTDHVAEAIHAAICTEAVDGCDGSCDRAAAAVRALSLPPGQTPSGGGLMRSLRAWLADVFLGPACPHRCGHRARGPRSLAAHCWLDHAGEEFT